MKVVSHNRYRNSRVGHEETHEPCSTEQFEVLAVPHTLPQPSDSRPGHFKALSTLQNHQENYGQDGHGDFSPVLAPKYHFVFSFLFLL